MAKVPLEMPHLGLIAENIQLVAWLKAEGDSFDKGEPILEVETEKSIVEVEAPLKGFLLHILVKEGETVSIGTAIAEIEVENEDEPVQLNPSSQTKPESEVQLPLKKERQFETQRLRISPAARRLARERRVRLEDIQGTGPNGRILLRDIHRVDKPDQQVQYSELSPMRRATARAMSKSAAIPQFWVEYQVDWTQVNALLRDVRKTCSMVSINDVLMKAVSRAILKFPQFNAIYVEGSTVNAVDELHTGDKQEGIVKPRLKHVEGVHVGLVVAVEDGLVVPVMHHLEQLSLVEIAAYRADLVKRARSGKLRQNELSGATFSISNMGADGPDRFMAMLNPPESAILAVGRSRDIPVFIKKEFVPRPVSQLILTIDHRVADGKIAGGFLYFLVQILEMPDWLSPKSV